MMRLQQSSSLELVLDTPKGNRIASRPRSGGTGEEAEDGGRTRHFCSRAHSGGDDDRHGARDRAGRGRVWRACPAHLAAALHLVTPQKNVRKEERKKKGG